MDSETPQSTGDHPLTHDSPPRKKRLKRLWRWLRWPVYFVLLLVLLIAAARPFMPWMIRSYVNSTLRESKLYRGKVGGIDLHLWRGAYSIRDLKLLKLTGNVPVPLFSADRVDLAVEWEALLHGKVVGRFEVFDPEVNFVDGRSEAESQTGSSGPWLQIISDLFPFDINSVRIHNGSIHFRSFKTQVPVDVYLSQLEASVDDLSNIQNSVKPLITTVHAKAMAMDQARFEFEMTLDPFSYLPTFHMAVRLMGLDVTKINDLALAYGKFDFKRGYFDLVTEVDAKEGVLAGYVKPLFRNLKVFDLGQDVKEDDPIQFFWTALVGATTFILNNQQRDQFGTVIPFTLNLQGGGPDVDILRTVGNILRNAFVRAYLPKLQNGPERLNGMHFEAPRIEDPISVGQHQ